MKKQISSNVKAHLLRGAFYLLLLVTVAVIPFALGQRAATKQSTVATMPIGDDPASETWSVTGSLTIARYEHTATLLASGKVIVAGGFDGVASLTSTELYDPVTGAWNITGSLLTPRREHTATLLSNGNVLVAGGFGVSTNLATAELYDPVSGIWTSAVGLLATARREHTATLLSNGKVLVTGGVGVSASLASTELYDPASGIWTPTGSLATARREHTATLLSNGKVLVTGGFLCCLMARCLWQEVLMVALFLRARNCTIRSPKAGVPQASSTAHAMLTPPPCSPTAQCLLLGDKIAA